MQKFVYVFVICSLVFLTGCTSDVAKLPHLDSAVITQERGFLVVKVGNFDYFDITRVQTGQEQKPAQYRIYKPSRIFLDSYAKSVYTIEPGTYYISFVAIDSERGAYYSEAPGVDSNDAIAYGAFKIQANEVLYLGDIECYWQSTNKIKKIILQDKMSEVKRDLASAGQLDLASRLQKAKFYLSGTKLSTLTSTGVNAEDSR